MLRHGEGRLIHSEGRTTCHSSLGITALKHARFNEEQVLLRVSFLATYPLSCCFFGQYDLIVPGMFNT